MKHLNLFVMIVGLCLGVSAGQSMAAGSADLPDLANPQSAAAGVAQQALAEDAKCTRCHDESENKPILSLYQTRHGVRADSRTPTCISCHGSSEGHLKNKSTPPDVNFAKTSSGTISSAAVQSEACLTCHRSGLRQHWDGSQHQSRDVPCATCHTVHTKSDPVMTKATQSEVCFSCHKEQRAQTHKMSTHPLDAGKMSCSDCHNPHGSIGPKLLIKKNVTETCWTCHAEKRGPFLWEHQPVADDCTNCHTPHGSTNPTLLKTRLPHLCQECHSGDHAKTFYSGANLPGGNITTINGLKPPQNQSGSNQVYSRDCLNCHSNIHGSNSPAGAKFQR